MPTAKAGPNFENLYLILQAYLKLYIFRQNLCYSEFRPKYFSNFLFYLLIYSANSPINLQIGRRCCLMSNFTDSPDQPRKIKTCFIKGKNTLSIMMCPGPYPYLVGFRAVGKLLECTRKNLVRQIQRKLRNINWCSCYELLKTVNFHTFLVSFMILVSCPAE